MFQKAVCPTPPVINDPLEGTIQPGGEFILRDQGLYNDIVIRCSACGGDEEPAEEETVEESFVNFLNGRYDNTLLLLLLAFVLYMYLK